MTVSRMVDCLYPPSTASELASIKASTGASMIALYVPGWGTPKVLGAPDPTAIAKIALSVGWQVVPILDPNHQPLPAPSALAVGHAMLMDWLEAIGADTSQPGSEVFDLEAGDFSADPSLCSELAAAWFELDNLRACQYGSPSGLTELSALPVSQRPERVWAAYYPGGTAWPASPASIAGLADGLWSAEGQRGWQFAGSVKVAGIGVDYSVVEWPGFGPPASPPPAPVDPPEPSPVVLPKGTYVLAPGTTLTVS